MDEASEIVSTDMKRVEDITMNFYILVIDFILLDHLYSLKTFMLYKGLSIKNLHI